MKFTQMALIALVSFLVIPTGVEAANDYSPSSIPKQSLPNPLKSSTPSFEGSDGPSFESTGPDFGQASSINYSQSSGKKHHKKGGKQGGGKRAGKNKMAGMNGMQGGKKHGGGKRNKKAMTPEQQAKKAEHRQKMLQKFDNNGDGKLDTQERAAIKSAKAERQARKAKRSR